VFGYEWAFPMKNWQYTAYANMIFGPTILGMKARLLIYVVMCLCLIIADPSYAQKTPPSPASRLTGGLDFYGGVSDINAFTSYTDQLWAGQSTFTPSVLHADYDGKTKARVAIGVGKLSRGSGATYAPIVEGWAERIIGKGTVRVGRFFAPFATQEWEYESKDGVQWSHEGGDSGVNLSLVRDRNTRQNALYGRVFQGVAHNTTMGLSLATGKSVSYGAYTQGMGLDFTKTTSSGTFRADWEHFRDSSSENFNFAFARYDHTKHAILHPYISRYDWSQKGSVGSGGSYHASVLGIQYILPKNLTLDAGRVFEGKRNRNYVQITWNATWQ
jgi:hypothetical protein